MCLLLILSNKLDLNPETFFTIKWCNFINPKVSYCQTLTQLQDWNISFMLRYPIFIKIDVKGYISKTHKNSTVPHFALSRLLKGLYKIAFFFIFCQNGMSFHQFCLIINHLQIHVKTSNYHQSQRWKGENFWVQSNFYISKNVEKNSTFFYVEIRLDSAKIALSPHFMTKLDVLLCSHWCLNELYILSDHKWPSICVKTST